ncbi:hypothetical protein [Christiangramia echinicola]|uniref:Uncharacterized protein n=1 Tax=Christiangramia echinicola TaxID=279359 RepID=A0A1H1R9I3_9FLAO|nr:hypothetical protein [Christiangramia echinicola]SDS32422.1 hypothetical protein SAMN04488552_2811 [Christiangramia echinicola]
MGKLYFKKSSKEEKINHPLPKKETIEFLLNYSKALNVVEYKKMKFETMLN